VTQEVLLRLWKYFARVDAERLEGWITRVTRNACFDALRRRRTRTALILPPGDHQPLDQVEDPGHDPERQAEMAEFREQVEQAIAQLGEPYRSILILREIQDLKYEQIAAALDLPLNTVKGYLFRARRTLRNHLQRMIHEETQS